MNAASFAFRVFHQSRMEWRHLYGGVLLWLGVLLFRQWHRAHEVKTFDSLLSITDLDYALEVASPVLAAAVVWRCVSADAPANAETYSLTRPIGQAALWCGKMLFMLCAIVLPTLMLLALNWRGFDLGTSQLMVMAGTVMLGSGLVCAAAGTVTALAASPRQVLTIAVLVVIGIGAWLVIPAGNEEEANMSVEIMHTQLCGSFIAAVLALGGLFFAWWLATVPRRRWLAAGGIVVTLVLASIIAKTWQKDWITLPEKKYANASKLGGKVGVVDPADKMPGRALWPTLRLTGLGKDEVASIVEFAPVKENSPWPPEGSYSDLPSENRGYASWMHHDHTRALFKHHPPATLWNDSIHNNAMYNGRKTLPEVLQALRMKREEAITQRWRLRLIVHDMKRVATLPFRQFWSQENTFLIRPGLRLEFNAYGWIHDAWELHGRAHHLSSAVLPVNAFRSATIRDRELGDGFFLVLEDRELRQNEAMSLNLVARSPRYSIYQNHSQLWQTNENQGFEVRMWMPREQEVILQRPLDEWIDAQNASLWHAEERGIVELELTPAQMALILPEPKPKEVKKP